MNCFLDFIFMCLLLIARITVDLFLITLVNLSDCRFLYIGSCHCRKIVLLLCALISFFFFIIFINVINGKSLISYIFYLVFCSLAIEV